MERQRTTSFLAPIILLALIGAGWEGACRALHIPAYFLPAPSAIYAALRDGFPLLAVSAVLTLTLTLQAFTIAVFLGIGIALAFSASRLLSNAALPLVIALQVTPVVAIAPLIAVWVGGDRPQLVTLILATIVAFFPMLANAMIGLRSTEPALRALFKLYGASTSQRFFGLDLPAAMPYLLSGMKISAGLALVGAVIAEFAAGSGASQGLAWRIAEAGNRLEIPRLFAALFLLTALGLTLFSVLSLIERRALSWHESRIG